MRSTANLFIVFRVLFGGSQTEHAKRRKPRTLIAHVTSVALAASALIFGFQTPAFSASFFESFDGTLSSGLSFVSDSGFHFNLVSGRGVLSKDAGIGNGFGYVTTDFQIIGDFSISVEMTRDNLNGIGEAGLNVSFAPSGFPLGFADVWSYGNTDVVGNIFVPAAPGYGTTVIPSLASTFTWGAERVGNTLTLTFDQGSGVQIVRSATGTNLGGSVFAQIFLGQETGNTSPHVASFDNFHIQADNFAPIPLPAALPLFLSGLACLGFVFKRHSRAI